MPLVEINGQRSHWNMVEKGLEYWGLRDWWLSTFSEDERKYIERIDIANHIGGGVAVIEDVNDEIVFKLSRPPRETHHEYESAFDFVDGLISLFLQTRVRKRNKQPYVSPQDETISDRLIEKADELKREVEEAGGLKGEAKLDKLFALLEPHNSYVKKIKAPYGDSKADSTALNQVIEACEKQIALAPEVAEIFKRINSMMEADPDYLPSHEGYQRLVVIREKQEEYAEAIRLSTQAKEQGWSGDWDKRIERCNAKLLKQGGKAKAKTDKPS